MLNMIKMDLYRMFRTKSTYVIWILIAAAVIFTTWMSKLDTQDLNKEALNQQTESSVQSEESEEINLGMSVSLPTQPGEKVTVFDQVYANLQSKFIALFILIFAVLFSSADINSGYIKNIGGQVKSRGNLIFSRAIALFIYTGLSLCLYLILQIVMQQVCFGYLVWGDKSNLLKYFFTQMLLHYALVLICMAIAVILNSSVLSMAISICLSMNLMGLIYSVVDVFIHKLGAKNFQLFDYTVTGKIALLPMAPGSKSILAAVCVAAVFGIGATAVTGRVFGKRDI
ncbi:ABC transporter permease [Blautia liquoris]|uniref:ABC transporter permease n=1 Tax=Blautia liquoris TaxID=2779518 RepID=A0A7M2RIP9_9FIRM|nr:ABC transporter permease [Blautia liquoris]QOV20206.1 ABC transporter permease [Blautia liquoris]